MSHACEGHEVALLGDANPLLVERMAAKMTGVEILDRSHPPCTIDEGIRQHSCRMFSDTGLNLAYSRRSVALYELGCRLGFRQRAKQERPGIRPLLGHRQVSKRAVDKLPVCRSAVVFIEDAAPRLSGENKGAATMASPVKLLDQPLRQPRNQPLRTHHPSAPYSPK
jgi:hypothetical protein